MKPKTKTKVWFAALLIASLFLLASCGETRAIASKSAALAILSQEMPFFAMCDMTLRKPFGKSVKCFMKNTI